MGAQKTIVRETTITHSYIIPSYGSSKDFCAAISLQTAVDTNWVRTLLGYNGGVSFGGECNKKYATRTALNSYNF